MPFLRSSINETLYNVLTFQEFIEVYHTFKNDTGVHINLVKIENTIPRKIVWGTLLLFLFFLIHIQTKHMRILKNRHMENTILPLKKSKRDLLNMDLIRKYDIEYIDSQPFHQVHKRKNIKSPKLSTGLKQSSSLPILHTEKSPQSSPLKSEKESF